jgi:hypothetical protein
MFNAFVTMLARITGRQSVTANEMKFPMCQVQQCYSSSDGVSLSFVGRADWV